MHGIQFVFQRSHSTEELSRASCVPKIHAEGHWQANQPLWPKQDATKIWPLYQVCLALSNLLDLLQVPLSSTLCAFSKSTGRILIHPSQTGKQLDCWQDSHPQHGLGGKATRKVHSQKQVSNSHKRGYKMRCETWQVSNRFCRYLSCLGTVSLLLLQFDA